MKDLIKKAGVASWLNIATAVLTLIGAILFIATNATQGYSVLNGGAGIAVLVIAIFTALGCTYSELRFGNQNAITAILRLVTLALLCIGFGVLISDRVGIASSLLTWDSANTVAWGALYSSIACIVFVIISVILLIVTGFMDSKKTED